MSSFISSASKKNPKISWTATGLLAAGTAIRIWELIDVWMLPSHYKVGERKTLQFYPLVFYDQKSKNLNWGLSLNYRF